MNHLILAPVEAENRLTKRQRRTAIPAQPTGLGTEQKEEFKG